MTEALGAAGAAETDVGAEARGESLLLPLLQGLLGGGGERLLAGLGAAPADVVADVRRSLGRLRAALVPPAAHPQARALLALADRLEDALDTADRLDGCRRRPRRRSRAIRHTVGVTHEELEEARRLVNRDNLALDPPVSSSAASSASITDEARTPDRKPSDGDNVSYHAAIAIRNKQPPLAHSVSHEPTTAVSHDIQVVERRAPVQRRPDFFRHSMADLPQQPPQPLRSDRRPTETKSSIAVLANKFDTNAQMERHQAMSTPRRAPVVLAPQQPAPKEDAQRSFFRPLPPTYNFAAPPITQDDSKPLNRFSSNKKLRMKRANTIDIGRPLAGYPADSETDDEPRDAPLVPEFRPQTENDKKFVAFMKKNEGNDRDLNGGGQANWSSRFGNIKNAFESRERVQDVGRAVSAGSSARRFWRASEENGLAPYARKIQHDYTTEVVKPPWVTERRDSTRVHTPHQPRAPLATAHHQLSNNVAAVPVNNYISPSVNNYVPEPAYIPSPAQQAVPMYAPAPAPQPAVIPAPLPLPAAVPHSTTRPIVVKPFAARPVPVNQFSHAPMSAFKPPSKIPSPTTAPAYVWSPPSLSAAASPSTERPPSFSSSPRPLTATTPPVAPWQAPESDKPRQTINTLDFQSKYESVAPPPQPRSVMYEPPPPPQPTHAPPLTHNYPVKKIPSQNNLAAPELVRRMDDVKQSAEPPTVDAQKLQIEFYERKIREKNARRVQPATRLAKPDVKAAEPSQQSYTVTDYTPKVAPISTFVPLQRTPDIEKTRAHKIDYLPDVVTNETDRLRSQAARTLPARSPTDLPPVYRNGDVYTNGTSEEGTTEHEIAVTRVMRGPVRGAATITAGVRTRHETGAADALRGALDKVSSPRRDAAERKKREPPRSQVCAPGRSPPPAPHVRPSPPSLGASRESVASSGSAASGGSALSRSGSWHQLAGTGGKSSPRRVVARAKSMHLLAIPKMYEGGIARDEVSEKQRTVEAYFAGQTAGTAVPAARSPQRRSGRAPNYVLGRSRTMGALSELHFLDESNADDAFEDLVSALA